MLRTSVAFLMCIDTDNMVSKRCDLKISVCVCVCVCVCMRVHACSLLSVDVAFCILCGSPW